jgi:hypothetical protein
VRKIVRSFSFISFYYMKRKANNVVDLLANMGNEAHYGEEPLKTRWRDLGGKQHQRIKSVIEELICNIPLHEEKSKQSGRSVG